MLFSILVQLLLQNCGHIWQEAHYHFRPEAYPARRRVDVRLQISTGRRQDSVHLWLAQVPEIP